MDHILITDLLIRCIIGVGEEERRDKQDVVINIVLAVDLRTPGKTDCFDDTVDYSAIKKRIIAMAENSQYRLVEALAERISEISFLEDSRILEAKVKVEKPSALRFAKSVGVEIIRVRG